jgi:hypothetical protein
MNKALIISIEVGVLTFTLLLIAYQRLTWKYRHTIAKHMARRRSFTLGVGKSISNSEVETIAYVTEIRPWKCVLCVDEEWDVMLRTIDHECMHWWLYKEFGYEITKKLDKVDRKWGIILPKDDWLSFYERHKKRHYTTT